MNDDDMAEKAEALMAASQTRSYGHYIAASTRRSLREYYKVVYAFLHGYTHAPKEKLVANLPVVLAMVELIKTQGEKEN